FQHFVNVLAAVPNLKRFTVKAATFADGTGDPHVRQKIHFQPVGAIAFARLTTAPRPVEAEAAWLVSANLGIRDFSIQSADFIEDFDVCGGIGTRCSTDG